MYVYYIKIYSTLMYTQKEQILKSAGGNGRAENNSTDNLLSREILHLDDTTTANRQNTQGF